MTEVEAAQEGTGVRKLALRSPSLGTIVQPLILAWAAFLGLFPLNDNSFFTHLATGRLILDELRIPTVDPYTFTAAGQPWTVQSWLASVAYAGAEQVGGAGGVRSLVLVVFLIAGALTWRLTRPVESLLLRLLLAAAGMVVASDVWSERPYMIGFIGLSLIWLALDGAGRPSMLVPVMWLWVNTHGSFPLGVVLCLGVLVGTWLDRRENGGAVALGRARQVTAWVIAGALLGAVSPLGINGLLFPFRSLAESAAFAHIVEWQPAKFTTFPERAFLGLLLVAIGAVVRTGRWRHAVPLIVFAGAAAIAQRNLVMALPIVVAVIASAAPKVGAVRSATRPAFGRLLLLVTASSVPLAVVVGLQGEPLGLGGYPTRALALLEVRPSPGRLVTQDFTGNLLEVLDGPSGSVFIDDRVDMLPKSLLDDYQTLHVGGPGWLDVLDRWDATRVVWKRSAPLASLLVADRQWALYYQDRDWIVASRR